MTEYEKLQLKCQKDIYFLCEHPAIGCGYFNFSNSLDFYIIQVCKNNYSISVKKAGITIFQNSKLGKRYKKEFEKEFARCKKEWGEKSFAQEQKLINIDIPYEKVFGYPWKFDHIEYWGDLSFRYFQRIITDKSYWKSDECFKDSLNLQNWCNADELTSKGRTFEEMIVNLTKKVKKIFGNFNMESFLTLEEVKNHNTEDMFIKKNGENGFIYSNSNPKYIHVHPSEINHRWLKWFLNTKYGKNHWGNSEEITKLININN